jgi:hypothetical protein
MKLLDLKQKQININEARIARFQATISGKLATLAELANEQAVESGKQGTSIMLVCSPPHSKSRPLRYTHN